MIRTMAWRKSSAIGVLVMLLVSQVAAARVLRVKGEEEICSWVLRRGVVWQ